MRGDFFRYGNVFRLQQLEHGHGGESLGYAGHIHRRLRAHINRAPGFGVGAAETTGAGRVVFAVAENRVSIAYRFSFHRVLNPVLECLDIKAFAVQANGAGVFLFAGE